MIGERGPECRRHIPSYRNGCYYNRQEDCCWSCFLRSIWAASEPDVREANRVARSSSFVETELEVPTIERVAEEESIE